MTRMCPPPPPPPQYRSPRRPRLSRRPGPVPAVPPGPRTMPARSRARPQGLTRTKARCLPPFHTTSPTPPPPPPPPLSLSSDPDESPTRTRRGSLHGAAALHRGVPTLCVCVCARARVNVCVCARARSRTCVCVCVCVGVGVCVAGGSAGPARAPLGHDQGPQNPRD